ncbi:glutathione S-transferase family protein [Pseudenhygromyxa sp. WMMC2535]|uniref:glutathione S-transferase family protein n=1 Tax=Pseudenhygromyxa sp. WMMC2535 TaxID=2712867 RepID=UPI0015534586|nr:glutathione S-transferase family protein [Pseudenhygromyxa sp. WMMC2535]NVB43114.1 glutathione S-transferase family protein [Pseudenhygromyxa sp. WMMC2535]
MTSITLYTATRPSSASPVEQALLELDIPHELVRLDLDAGEQKRPEFLAINPNGLVPALVIDEKPMFEGLAIMQYLGDRFGVERGLWPAAGSAARLRAVSWSTWSYAHLQPFVRLLIVSTSAMVPEALHHPPLAELARAELKKRLTVLEGELERDDYLLGSDFSLADLIVAGVLGWGVSMGVSLDGLPRTGAWLKRCMSRPSGAKLGK